METRIEHRSIKVLALLVVFLASTGTLIYLTATTAFMEPIANWTPGPDYPFDVASRNAVVHDRHIYVFGGIVAPESDPRTVTSEVRMARINDDGTLAGWTRTRPMPQPLYNHAVVADDTHVYVVGGYDTSVADPIISRSVHRAAFTSGGGLGAWETFEDSFPGDESRGINLHAMELIGNRIYVFGGWDGNGPLDFVRYTQIDAGGIGSWETVESNPLPVKLARSASAQHNGYVYLVGGGGRDSSVQFDTIYYARINADDSLGTWQEARKLPSPIHYHQAVIHDGRLVVLGGFNSNSGSTNQVISSEIAGNGILGEWQTEVSMNTAVFRFAAVSVPLWGSDFIYTIGGWSNASPFTNDVNYTSPPPTPTPTPTPGISAVLNNSPSDWLAPGEVVTYEITLSGNNVSDFDDVLLSNDLPSQTELVTDSITAGNSTAYTITTTTWGTTVEWYYPTFAKDDIDRITYGARRLVPSPPDIAVTFSIEKTGPATAVANAPITYTIAVTNNTDIRLSDIVVEDEMPIGATYLSGGDGPPDDDGMVRWTVDSLAAKERREFQFAVTAEHTLVNSNYRVRSGDGGNISGYAVVVTQIGDTSPPPNGDGVAIVNRGAVVEWTVNGTQDQNQSNSIRNPMTDFFVPFAPKE